MPYANPEDCKKYYSEHKEQIRTQKKIWYAKNKKYLSQYRAEYRKKHKKKLYKQQREWMESHREYKLAYHKEYNKEWYAKNKKRRAIKSKQWYAANQDKINKHRMTFYNKHKLRCLISSAIRGALRGAKAGHKWESLVGYSLDELKLHLESQFESGMTWGNLGIRGWSIDHIIPDSLWEYTKPEDSEFKQSWALCNLMPRWHTTAIARKHGSKQVGNSNKGAKLYEREMRQMRLCGRRPKDLMDGVLLRHE